MTAAWKPGDEITESISLKPILASIGFGQSDVDSWSSIVAKLTARKVFTVGDLQTWTADEILSMLRALEKKGGLAKTPRAYLAMLASHLTIEFDETAGGIAASMGQGADWAAHCTKVRPSKGFNSSTYSPDQRLWAELPSLGSKNFLSSEEEHFLGDLLLLDAHAHPEKSYGEYLPPGMAARLAFLADQLLPPLQPFNAGSNNPRPRKKKKMITNRWTNARNGGEFKRIVLDEAYRQHFTERIACRLQFVETGSDQLDPKTNRRNWYFGIALKIASGEIQVCCRPPPRVVCIECMSPGSPLPLPVKWRPTRDCTLHAPALFFSPRLILSNFLARRKERCMMIWETRRTWVARIPAARPTAGTAARTTARTAAGTAAQRKETV